MYFFFEKREREKSYLPLLTYSHFKYSYNIKIKKNLKVLHSKPNLIIPIDE